MMTEELKIRVSLDTQGLKNSVKQIKQILGDTTSEFGGIDKATTNATSNVNAMTTGMKAMGAATMAQTGMMVMAFNKVNKSTQLTRSHMKNIGEEIRNVFNFKHFDVGKSGIKGYLESMKIQLKEAGVSAKALAKTLSPLLANAMKKVGLAAAAVVGTISGLIIGLSHISESTREFRQAVNQVSTSFISLGSDAETATEAYKAFFRVLGDVNRSTEAANLLAQITTTEKDLVTWTRIATGALAMFPDSLPTESLIEASNETIKTAKVTGVLADALNWPAGAAERISKALEGSAEAQQIFNQNIAKGLTVEDSFNAVLAATNSEAQREVILRASLNGIYAESARLYEENNKALIAQNEAQNKLNQAMATLGKITQPLQTAFTNFKATLANALAPAIKVVVDWLVVLVDWLTTAAMWVGAFLSVLFPGAAEKISSAFNGVTSAVEGATGGTGGLNEGLKEAEGTAQKLRRTLMGFDELNVVTDMSASASGSGSDSSSGIGGIDGIDVSGLETGDSIFKKAQSQMEEMKQKVKDFLDEFKTELTILGAALGTLGIANLLSHLGEAIGLGDKFLGVMNTIKKLAATAITIVLQYSLVNEFMDRYIDGEGFKEYLKGLLVAAIGTGVLYAMWGPTGLMIGLAVTAVASIKAVIDNGGITNAESAVVALTGLAAALGAVTAAVKVFNLGKVVSDIGAFFTLLKEGNGLIATLAAAFPNLAGAISSIKGVFAGAVSAISGFAGAIGTALGATGSAAVAVGAAVIVAAIAGIVGIVVSLTRNWEEVTAAFKKFFEGNIVPKLKEMKEHFQKIGKALAGLIPQSVLNALKSAWEWIKKVAAAIGEWFKSIDWLKGIGDAFEWIGNFLVGVIGGTIMGAINALVGAFENAAQAISGAVQIISGLIQLIVSLFTWDLAKAKDACQQIMDGIVDLFKGLWGLVTQPLRDFVNGVIDFFVGLWDELVGHSIVPDMINAIVEWFWSLPTKIFGKLDAFVKGVIQRFTDMWNNVKTATTTKLEEIRSGITNAWNNIKSYFTTNIAPKLTLDYWRNKFDTIRSALQSKLDDAKTQVMKSWDAIKSYFNTNIAPKLTVAYWKTKFDAIKSGASTKLEEVKSTIMNAWSGIKSWFTTNVSPKFTVSYWTTKWNTIKDGARAAFNGVIAVVEKAVNGIIKKINTLSWTIPDWVPGFGGDTFGFNFRTISIPRLAEGGIAVGSTLANIGERGKEAVLPLENNTGWMDSLADRLAARMNPATRVVLKVDERELGYATINAINQNTKQTGGLKLQLV